MKTRKIKLITYQIQSLINYLKMLKLKIPKSFPSTEIPNFSP